MNNWDINEIFLALNLKNNFNRNFKIKNIVIDSKKIKKGDLFIAIKGKKFDGHKFIDEAFKNGASAVIGEKKKVISNFPVISVDDTKKSLIDIATFSRKRIKDLIVVGITGSTGKTTLKEWLFSILKDDYKTYCNYGNFNNEIGMPLTLCNMPLKSQICILEMGMNNKGEIKRLAKIARPNVNIITNIGTAHVGNLINRKGIAREKSDIFFYSNQKDYSIIPSDDEFYELLKIKASKKVNSIYTFGKKKISTFQYFDSGYEDKKVKFKIFDKDYNFQKKISFNNWENNVVVILGLIKVLNLKIKYLKKKIEQLKPIEGRGKLHSIKVNNKKIVLIDESYNSSPDSLKKSIENLKYFKKNQGRIICIIGDMLELGKNSTKMHIEVSEILKKVKPEIVYTLGKHTSNIQKDLPKTIKSHHFVDYKKIYNEITRIIKTNDVIMIKGSNSSKVNFISKQLIESE